MSTSTTGETLSKAYRLIEADELAAARAILQPILDETPDNVDAWWLYAHAVTDPSEARKALDNVLRLDSNYPGAVELSRKLDAVLAEGEETVQAPATEEPTAPAIPPKLPEADEAIELEPEESEPVEERESSPLRTVAVLAVVAILIIFAAVVVLPRLTGGTTAPGTDVASEPTVESPDTGGETTTDTTVDEGEAPITGEDTGDTEAEPTQSAGTGDTEGEPTDGGTTEGDDAQPTAEDTTGGSETDTEAAQSAGTEVALVPDAGPLAAVESALSAFTLAPDALMTTQTTLGETMMVSVCSTAGQQARQDLPMIMEILAGQAAAMPTDLEAVAARLVNCETSRPFLIIAVNRGEAVNYATGNLSLEQFQLAWQPQ